MPFLNPIMQSISWIKADKRCKRPHTIYRFICNCSCTKRIIKLARFKLIGFLEWIHYLEDHRVCFGCRWSFALMKDLKLYFNADFLLEQAYTGERERIKFKLTQLKYWMDANSSVLIGGKTRVRFVMICLRALLQGLLWFAIEVFSRLGLGISPHKYFEMQF